MEQGLLLLRDKVIERCLYFQRGQETGLGSGWKSVCVSVRERGRGTDRQTRSSCMSSSAPCFVISFSASHPDLLNPNLKSAVLCAMKISQQPQGLRSW